MTNLYKNHNCNAVVFLKDGNMIELSTDQLHSKNLHHWKGWSCNVGVDNIFIDNDYTVYAGMCQNDKLGNLFDENFMLLRTPAKCKQQTCTSCSSDLFATKFKDN